MPRHRTTRARFLLPLALTALLFAGVAWAFPGGGGRQGPFAGLDLPPDTREAVRGIFEESRQDAELLRAAVQEEREQLRWMMDDPEPDRDAILAQVDRLSGVEAEVARHRVLTMLDVLALLTPEQRLQAREAMEERRARRHQRRAGRGGGPPEGFEGAPVF